MNERSLRMSSAVRGILITYGVAGFSWLFARTLPTEEDSPVRGMLVAFGIGVALQVLALLVRAWLKRYERAHGMEGALYPQAAALFALLADAVTVLLFAVTTFKAIASYQHF